MPRRALIAIIALFISATLLLAEHGVVVTRDGNTFEGEVTETEQSVTITIRGVETIIPRADVESIRYSESYEVEFRDRLSKLAADDVRGRIALARDAFQQRRYDLAREALNDALRVDPNSRDATDMLDVVERQIRLERTAPAAGEEGAGRGAAGQAAQQRQPQQRGTTDRRLVTPDDINQIRQKELKPTDNGVRINFRGDVRQRFALQQNMTFAEFNRLSPVQQALQIIDLGDDEMRQQVRIATDPSALAEYKRNVQPVVLSQCATAGCHGGPRGGGFVLFTPADSDAVAYTNFYILKQYSARAEGPNPGGIFGTSMRKMIDRSKPEASLLLHFGLPTNIAEFDHPPVDGKAVQPAFRNREDSRYRQVFNWISNSLVRIEPDYEIDYPLPRATTQPAEPEPDAGGAEPTR